MTDTIISIDDYRSQLTTRLSSLRHFERCLFSAWCAKYLLTTHTELIEQCLLESDRQVLRLVLDEIWDVLLTGSIPGTKLLNNLDGEFMGVGPDDPETYISPIVTDIQKCVGLCILGCRRNSVALAQMAGEEIINVLEFQLDDRNPEYTHDSLQERFKNPDMQHELDAQLAMIVHLRGQYTLDETLRLAFRQ